MRIGYYPGCSLEGTAKEYDLSVRAVSQRLNIDLVELPDWSCCGASSGHCTDYFLSLALPARNLTIAEKLGLDIAAPCAACSLRLKAAVHELRDNLPLRSEIEEMMGIPYEGRVKPRHMLEVIFQEVDMESIKNEVSKPLEGLKVVAYYGCYLVRPPEVAQFDDPENPRSMDRLMEHLGVEVMDWSYKTDCCGGSLALTRPDIVTKLVGDLLGEALKAGANSIVTACPLCQTNLDSKQPKGEGIPVFYFSELMGLSLGIEEAKSWWGRHLVSPLGLLKSVNLA